MDIVRSVQEITNSAFLQHNMTVRYLYLWLVNIFHTADINGWIPRRIPPENGRDQPQMISRKGTAL